jgi:hypothetical protein
LQAVVYTLMQVLVERGVDPGDLDARIQAAVKPLLVPADPHRDAPQGSGPYR